MIPGAPGTAATSAFNEAARGNAWWRRVAFAIVAYVIVRLAWASQVDRWRFPLTLLVAVVAFEVAIVILKKRERDHGLEGDALLAARHRNTLVATVVLCGVMLIAAGAFVEPWYAVVAVLFGYVGFMFSRYVPDALFGAGDGAHDA